ncbi:MAG: tRNA1(Val) (adenine(37)-N6)-methyltransferase [Paracoccaceae bacterium]
MPEQMIAGWAVQTLSDDKYLDGRLRIWQPRAGYRAGVDPVLLAAAVNIRAGQSVLELGCGVGTASLCLKARGADLRLTGLELQGDHAALAAENGRRNGMDFEVITGDLALMPAGLKARQFDHVIANPPYFDRASSTASEHGARETAMGEAVPLGAWMQAAAKRCAPKGYVHMIHRAERLPDLLEAARGCLGSVEVLPLIARAGRAAGLVIFRARRGGRADFRLWDAVVMHKGAAHLRDEESYTDQMVNVLRHGAALEFSGAP